MTPPAGILAAGLFFAAAGLVATLLSGSARPPGRRPFPEILAQMALTIACGAGGAFAASRALPPDRILVAAAVMASLAAAVYAGATGRALSFYAVLVPLAAVSVAAALDAAWPTLGYGVVAALPFGISAALCPRPAALSDTLLCGLTGVTLGLMPAFFVLFMACLTAIGVARWKHLPASAVRFAPYVAAFTLIGILTSFALVV